jgi:hypothetical protein
LCGIDSSHCSLCLTYGQYLLQMEEMG